MQAISTEFSKALLENSTLLVKAKLKLADGTVKELTGDDITAFSYEQATSSDQSFDVGSAIIGKCSITLNNHDRRFDKYDFTGATIAPYVGKRLGDTLTVGEESGGISIDVVETDGGDGTVTAEAHVRKSGRLLSSEEVSRVGILRWYKGGKLIASGAECKCSAGDTIVCRLEA